MSVGETTYSDVFYDKFNRQIKYLVVSVPYEALVANSDGEFVFSGSVVNRLLELRENLMLVVDKMDTKKRDWVVRIDYASGRFKVINEEF